MADRMREKYEEPGAEVKMDEISAILPDYDFGRKAVGADRWCWESENKQLEVVIDYDKVNALTVNRFSYGFLDPNAELEVKYGPAVIINDHSVDPIEKVEVAPWPKD